MRPASTPLCPAGHLPHKGGDHIRPEPRLCSERHGSVQASAIGARRRAQPISPLVGEMVGRPEGGANHDLNLLWEEQP
jgi:hypothetical protein